MLTLLAKDFKLIFAGGKAGKSRILSYAVNALLLVLAVAVETFIFLMILTKLKTYNNALLAFLTIFLVVISLLMIVVCTAQAKKLLFGEKDVELLTSYPVSNSQIILSKIIFLFLLQVVTGLLFAYPVIVSYGILFNRTKWFYYIGLFYPVLAFPFECGVALLLVYPVKLLGDFLKKHQIAQFVFSVAVLFALCWLYSRVLDIFVSLIASNNFNALFNSESIEGMISARRFMVPVNWLVDVFFMGRTDEILQYLCVALGVFAAGLAVSVAAFNFFRRVRFNPAKRRREYAYKLRSVRAALVKKECALLFKDSANMFTFTGLLIVQPFLVYLVVSSINTIFSSGILYYYVAILPNFLPVIDILLVMLMSLTVSQGANTYIGGEGKNIRLMKSLPVGVYTQLVIKVALPLVISAASVVVTYLVLCIFGVITAGTMLFGLLMTLLVHVVFSVISLYEELKIRHNRQRSYFLSSTISYVLPIVYSVAMIVLSYFGLNIYAVYAIGIGIAVVSGLPCFIGIRGRVCRLFDELEVVN